MNDSAVKIRKDGKPQRTPRLGLQASGHNGLVQPEDQDRQNWHELVQAGPKGDPTKRLARAERIAAARTRSAVVVPLVDAQQNWHFDHAPNHKPGRLVLHRPRPATTLDPNPTNKRRRYLEKLRRAIQAAA